MKKQLPTIKLNLDRIAAEREMKAPAIADLCHMSKVTVYGLLSHRCSPSMKTLNKLAAGLNVTYVELFRQEI